MLTCASSLSKWIERVEPMQFPRPYRKEEDLQRMLDLLVEGRRAATGTYYVHTGDLKWWLYYPSEARDWREAIFLWDQPDGGLLG